MFEYLMPLLVMPTYERTLLDADLQGGGGAADRVREQARRALGHLGVRLQHDRRAPQLPVPRLRRARAGAQARARGRPGHRALCLGAGADGGARGGVPEPAAARRGGLRGSYGFYEAIDYTPSRLPRGQTSAVVRSFMAHHQGMSLLSLAHLLLDRPMQRRFDVGSAVPGDHCCCSRSGCRRATAHLSRSTAELSESPRAAAAAEAPVRIFDSPDTPLPRCSCSRTADTT